MTHQANVKEKFSVYDVYIDSELSKTFNTYKDAYNYAYQECDRGYASVASVEKREFYVHTCPCCGAEFHFCQEKKVATIEHIK